MSLGSLCYVVDLCLEVCVLTLLHKELLLQGMYPDHLLCLAMDPPSIIVTICNKTFMLDVLETLDLSTLMC